MAETHRRISRRGFLMGGAAGGAAAAVAVAAGGRTAGADPIETRAGGVLGVVADDTVAGQSLVPVRVGETLHELEPSGFPPGWHLRAGDLVYADTARARAWPHVEAAVVPGGWGAVPSGAATLDEHSDPGERSGPAGPDGPTGSGDAAPAGTVRARGSTGFGWRTVSRDPRQVRTIATVDHR